MVTTACDTLKIIQDSKPVHIGILDRGVQDINNDEYFILRKYSSQIPLVVISDTTDIERAYEATTS
jgi:DNA-binding NtrC family response regulator